MADCEQENSFALRLPQSMLCKNHIGRCSKTSLAKKDWFFKNEDCMRSDYNNNYINKENALNNPSIHREV